MERSRTKPVFHYDTSENDYKFLSQFASAKEVFKMYYGGKVGRLIQKGQSYKQLPDGTYVSFKRLGRKGLRKLVRESTDPTIIKRKDDKEIELINGKGEVVGIVANKRILEALIGITKKSIDSKLFDDPRKPQFGNLGFKYKTIRRWKIKK